MIQTTTGLYVTNLTYNSIQVYRYDTAEVYYILCICVSEFMCLCVVGGRGGGAGGRQL